MLLINNPALQCQRLVLRDYPDDQRVIIYDDNLSMIICHAEAFLKRKEKYYLFSFYLFLKERPLPRVL